MCMLYSIYDNAGNVCPINRWQQAKLPQSSTTLQRIIADTSARLVFDRSAAKSIPVFMFLLTSDSLQNNIIKMMMMIIIIMMMMMMMMMMIDDDDDDSNYYYS